HLGGLAPEDLHQDIHDEPGADAHRDAVGERHQDHREQGGKTFFDVVEVDVLDQGAHEEPDQDQHRGGRLGRDETGQRGEEDREKEQHADSDGGEARSAPFGDSGGAFDVAGVRTDAGQAADGGAGGVDDQEGSDVGDPSVLVDQVRLFDDGRGRAHRVEEVREHEGEDRQEGGDDAERREHLAEVELPQRGERRSRRPGVRQGRHPHQVGDDGGDEDAEDQRSLDSAGVEQDRDRQTDERHSRSPRVGEEELDRDRPLGDLGDQTAVDESDEEDEETDADADRPLQRHRDSFHDRLPETHQHQHQDDETFEDDHAHRSGRAQPVAQNEPEGDGAVDAQTGGERDRVVGEDAHGDAQQPGDERGAGGYRPRVEAGGAEDVGVDEDDVGHHQERGDTGAYLGA